MESELIFYRIVSAKVLFAKTLKQKQQRQHLMENICSDIFVLDSDKCIEIIKPINTVINIF